MEANTLRIRNLLQDQFGNLLKVVELTEKSIVTSVIDRSKFPLPDGWKAQPIPIDEYWLLKIGFQRFPWGLVKGELLFKDNIQDPCKELTLEIGNGFRTTVKFIHELQNLYFALTNLELTIKE